MNDRPDAALPPPPDEVLQRARGVRMVIFDVDGVMTDGRLFYGDDGQEYKAFHSLDGHGIKMLRDSGVKIAIITGRTSRLVQARAANVGVHYLFQGADDKLTAFHDLLRQAGLPPEATAFMGDDVVDLPVMRRCGLALSVPSAWPLARSHAHYVTRLPAGGGAVREVCELLMDAQGTLQAQLERFLR